MRPLDPMFEGIDAIPDPAARAAQAPAPPATVPAERSPTRDERRARARLVIAGAGAWLVVALIAIGVRHDIGSPLVLLPLAAWAITIVAGLAILLRPGQRGLPPAIRAVQHALWIVPAIYVAVVMVVGEHTGGPPFGWETVRGCLGLANLAALGPLAAAVILMRGSFLSGAGWRGAAVGALAGLAGSLGAHAHCPVGSLDHLLAAHGPPIVIAAGLGALFGRMRGRA